MDNHSRAAVWGGFVADALALGAHWIYDTDRIDREMGRVEAFLAPPDGGFHSGKDKGQFTHYGDQMMVLLRSTASSGAFDLERFFWSWQSLFRDYSGYVDRATRETLEGISAGKGPTACGSGSADLSGAARFAALAYHLGGEPDAFAAAARAQAAMTHSHPHVVDAAEFFARVTSAVLQGQSPVAAVRAVERDRFRREPFSQWVAQGLDSAGTDTRSAIKGFGQMCDIEAGFPGVLHLIGKYEKDFRRGLVENVMAGGDSAARGIVAGSVLGAGNGMSAIPDEWRRGLAVREELAALLGDP